MNYSDYKILEKLHESDLTIVYRGEALLDLSPVIIKTLNQDFPTDIQLNKFRHEYNITQRLAGKSGIWQTQELVAIHNTLVIVGDDIGGVSLCDWCNTETDIDIENRLEIALHIVSALTEIHLSKVIHKDISADNIILNPVNKSVQIIDFGLASVLNHEFHEFQNVNELEGNLAYISPEQTGRINRILDYRSDLYSLGVLLYKLFTGNLPFKETEHLSLIHSQICKVPIEPRAINPLIPWPLSNIIMRLLDKVADNRYQTCEGLYFDLERCLQLIRLEDKSKIAFTIGEKDFLPNFNIPQKLYGRSKHTVEILEAYKKACHGQSELIFISGSSGTGKSALVHEIYKPLTLTSGMFISGKFEQYQRDIPFFGWIQAVEKLIQLMIKEKEEQLVKWQLLIEQAAGELGQVLTELIPSLEFIIGKQPEVSELTGTQAVNRLSYIFIKFIRTLATKEHPLVIFMDDWQWADSASLALLKKIADENQDTHLLLINAYRDNEVNDSHLLTLIINHIADAKINTTHIHLDNLLLSDVHDLMSDMLFSPPHLDELVGLVYEKTAGNAFFLIEFLETLKARALIKFDSKNGHWYWHYDVLLQQNISGNVIELLSQKLITFAPETQQVLKFSAFINNTFSLKMLSSVLGIPDRNTLQALEPAIKEEVIRPSSPHYQYSAANDVSFHFAHDKVQQAAYLLPVEINHNEIHLQIAKAMEINLKDSEQEKQLFDIVNHYNKAKQKLTEITLLHKLIILNIKAGKKAMKTSAFGPAYNYFSNAIELLPENAWEHYSDICSELFLIAAESALFETKYTSMELWLDEFLANSRLSIEQAEVWVIRLQAYTAQNRLVEAVNASNVALGLLGVKLNSKPSTLNVMVELVKTKYRLAGKSIDDLLNLPKMTDPKSLLIMKILGLTVPSAYWTSQNLVAVIVFKMTQYSVLQGYSPMAGYAFSWWGITAATLLNDIKSGTKYGQLGIDIANRFDLQLQQPVFFMGWILSNYEHPIRDSIALLNEAYEVSLEKGDNEFASYALNNLMQAKFHSAFQLDKLTIEMKNTHQSLLSFGFNSSQYWHDICWQTALNFHQECDDPSLLVGEAYNETIMLSKHQSSQDHSTLFLLYFNKLLLSYYFNDYQQAMEFAKEAKTHLMAGAGMYAFSTFFFYESLIILALVSDCKNDASLLKIVKKNQKKLKAWSTYSPENFLHKWQLVEAQFQSIKGNFNRAIALYGRAIEGAEKSQLLHEQALAHELSAKFYLNLNQLRVATADIKQAHYLYSNWHADNKVKHLEQSYMGIIPNLSRGGILTNNSIATSTKFSEQLDLSSLIRSAQLITKEITLDKLTMIFLRIIMESGGGQRGFLFLADTEGELKLETMGWVEELTLSVTPVKPSDEHNLAQLLPLSVVNYAKRSKQDLVIDNMIEDPRFLNDEYFDQKSVYSCFVNCILYQDKVLGVLYLENNLLQNAFCQKNIEIVKLLSAQAAISISNAHLFQAMEQDIKVNRDALQASLNKQEKLNKQLTQSNQKLDDTYLKLHEANLQLLKLANTDGLTNLANRKHFNQRLEEEFNRACRIRQPLTLLFCDIDNFKAFNENFGHIEGDEALRQVALVLKSLFVRSSDLIARYSGEEFAVVLPDIDKKQAQLICQRLLEAVKALNINHPHNPPFNVITISVGSHTVIPEIDMALNSFLQGADTAMYEAKNKGQNSHIHFVGS